MSGLSNNPVVGDGAGAGNGDSVGEAANALRSLGEAVTGLDGQQVVAASGHTGSEGGAGLDGTVGNPNVVAPPAGGVVDIPEGSGVVAGTGVVAGAGVAPGAGGVVDPAPVSRAGVAGTGGQGVGGAAQGTSEVANGDQLLTRRDLVDALREVLNGPRTTGGPTRTVLAVPEPFATQGVSADEYARFGTYLKAVKVSPPERWGGDEKGREVHFFLSELSAFYEMTALPKVFWAVVARTHLAWKPRESWDRELEHLQSQPGATAVTWEHFVLFMKRSYASLLPARETRQRYDRLKQTGSVRDFVREQVQLVRELTGTPYQPGGSVFDDFINGLKADVRRFVEDHAPTGWWTNIQDLYQKAVDYEINGLARTGTSGSGGGGGSGGGNGGGQQSACKSEPESESRERRYAGKKRGRASHESGKEPAAKRGAGAGSSGGGGPFNKGSGNSAGAGTSVWIPDAELKARKKAGVCGHIGKNCPNPKSLTPSFADRG